MEVGDLRGCTRELSVEIEATAACEACDVLAAAARVEVIAAGVIGDELVVAGTAEELVTAICVLCSLRLVLVARGVVFALVRRARLLRPFPALAEERVVAVVAVEVILARRASEKDVLLVAAVEDVAVAAVDVCGEVEREAGFSQGSVSNIRFDCGAMDSLSGGALRLGRIPERCRPSNFAGG